MWVDVERLEHLDIRHHRLSCSIISWTHGPTRRWGSIAGEAVCAHQWQSYVIQSFVPNKLLVRRLWRLFEVLSARNPIIFVGAGTWGRQAHRGMPCCSSSIRGHWQHQRRTRLAELRPRLARILCHNGWQGADDVPVGRGILGRAFQFSAERCRCEDYEGGPCRGVRRTLSRSLAFGIWGGNSRHEADEVQWCGPRPSASILSRLSTCLRNFGAVGIALSLFWSIHFVHRKPLALSHSFPTALP